MFRRQRRKRNKGQNSLRIPSLQIYKFNNFEPTSYILPNPLNQRLLFYILERRQFYWYDSFSLPQFLPDILFLFIKMIKFNNFEPPTSCHLIKSINH